MQCVQVIASIGELGLADNGYMPRTGSKLLTAALFTGLGDWFGKVSYIGAFNAGDTWMDGWTNFDPQNAKY